MSGTATLDGLSGAQVASRRADGRVNVASRRTTRSTWAIMRSNVFTRFNAIIGTLLGVVLVFGQWQDGLFGLVIVVNSAVGIVQELRAKRTLDALALLDESAVRVRRSGVEVAVPPGDLVLGDLVLLAAGEKVPVDGEVVAVDGLEIDESLLTGEADPVSVSCGDRVLSGSFVVAGGGAFVATAVGDDAYASRLVADARRFDLTRSELMTGINRILRIVTWLIVPIGGLLVVGQLRSTTGLSEAMVGSVAGVVPMIPEGLVLMTSVAFAVGVVRLGRRRCLVQQLPAVEVLARVDVLCVDKTGTLTSPGLDLTGIHLASGHSPGAEVEVRKALAALSAADPQPNPTMRALATAGGPDGGWQVRGSVPFSSARKYSAATFDGAGSWVLGAPDVILAVGDPQRDEAEVLGREGLRVVALGRLPDGLRVDGSLGPVLPVALVALGQHLRPEAAQTLAYLSGEGVTVKVLSGDNAASVGAVAAMLSIPGADAPVDARQLPDDPAALAAELAGHSVFGRVTPQQKRDIVAALRAQGHTVAMTGDGVNDAPALKDADLGIAMGSGSPATRAVAKVVLLDDSFAALPAVLAEGRRVLGNIERVAGLFLIKTMYSLVLAVLVGLAHVPFPFLPRHVTLVGSLTIGIPGFFLALAPNHDRARPGFVPRVLRFAIPAGLICGLAAFAAYGIARLDTGSDQTADRSTATLTLFLSALWALALLGRPSTRLRTALILAMAATFALIAALPWSAHLFALSFTNLVNDGTALAVAAVAATAMTVLRRFETLPQRVSD